MRFCVTLAQVLLEREKHLVQKFTIERVACLADDSEVATQAKEKLESHISFCAPKEAQAMVVLGGDGFMLHCLHEFMDCNIPFYGMNCGTVGFLLNEFREENLLHRINFAKEETLHPLHMVATDQNGKEHHALAINEVSLLRETRQAAKLQVRIDEKTRLEELVCDGILVSTPAGSTAYNLSVNGPIVPLGTDLLALTPISPFRPRRWRGALLPHKAMVEFNILSPHKRPVSAVADFTEIRDVAQVQITEDQSKSLRLLFDDGHSLEERIVREQFIH